MGKDGNKMPFCSFGPMLSGVWSGI